MIPTRYVIADHRGGIQFNASVSANWGETAMTPEALEFIADLVGALQASPHFSNVHVVERAEIEVPL